MLAIAPRRVETGDRECRHERFPKGPGGDRPRPPGGKVDRHDGCRDHAIQSQNDRSHVVSRKIRQSIIPGEKTVANTSAPRVAAARLRTPVPAATSNTRWPGPTLASRKRRGRRAL